MSLTENNNPHVSFAFMRSNPPHFGHKGVISTVSASAKKGAWAIFFSKSQDAKKNPLDYQTKLKWVYTLYPETKGHIVEDPNIKTFLQAAAYLYDKGFRSATFVAGSDDLQQMRSVLEQYNGKEVAHGFYQFEPLTFVESPRLTTATSAREAAKAGDADAFERATQVPQNITVDGKTLFQAVRAGMGLGEAVEESITEDTSSGNVIFLNDKTAIVGQEHGQPLKLTPDELKKVQAIAEKYGVYYEGNGADRAHTKGQLDKYIRSWDNDVVVKSKNTPYQFLYTVFANVDANNRIAKFGNNPDKTIFDVLLSHPRDVAYQNMSFDSATLKKFLTTVSEPNFNFLKMSQQPATKENIAKFLKVGESRMWPENWEQYPNPAGKVAKAANDVRDVYLASRKSGVYTVGSGHLIAVRKLLSAKNESISESTEKATKVEAKYQDFPHKGKQCDDCTMWRPPHGCTAVKGKIRASGWCKWWEKASKKKLKEDDAVNTALSVADTAADYTVPYYAAAKDAKSAWDDFKSGNYGSAAINAASAAIGGVADTAGLIAAVPSGGSTEVGGTALAGAVRAGKEAILSKIGKSTAEKALNAASAASDVADKMSGSGTDASSSTIPSTVSGGDQSSVSVAPSSVSSQVLGTTSATPSASTAVPSRTSSYTPSKSFPSRLTTPSSTSQSAPISSSSSSVPSSGSARIVGPSISTAASSAAKLPSDKALAYAKAVRAGKKVANIQPSSNKKVINSSKVNENMDHDKDGQAVAELKAALLARKDKLQGADSDTVYDTIDKIMTRIAKAHGISGQKIHDMWVKEYGEIPDTWIMNESVQIDEAATDILYHYTGTSAALSILQEKQFKLSSALGSVEVQYAPKDYNYFLSTARSRSGGYHHYTGTSAVMFVLDGRWISSRYPVKAINYWAGMDRGDRHSETEDRVFSKDPTMPITPILEMHVLLKEQNEYQSPVTRKLLIAAKQAGIPTYLYKSEDAWRLQDTRRSVSIVDAKEVLRGQEVTRYRSRGTRWLKPILDLLTAKSEAALGDRAKKMLRNVKYYWNDANDYYFRESIQGIKNDFSNARKPGSDDYDDLTQIISIMRQNRISSIPELMLLLNKKWAPKTERVNESKLLDKPTPRVDQLAEKYHTSIGVIEAQLKKGIKVEMEHTSKVHVAREIALDHINEKLDYYTRLEKVEEHANGILGTVGGGALLPDKQVGVFPWDRWITGPVSSPHVPYVDHGHKQEETHEEVLDEVNMSPTAIKNFAKSLAAAMMTIGFEAEMIVPDLEDPDNFWGDDDDEDDYEYGRDEDYWDMTKDIPFPTDSNWKKTFKKWFKDGNNSSNESYEVIEAIAAVEELYHDYREENELSKSPETFTAAMAENGFNTLADFVRDFSGLGYPYLNRPEKPKKITVKELAKMWSNYSGYKAIGSEGYHDADRKPNLWIFEPDSSISPNDSDHAGIELISPPMPFREGMVALDRFFAWASSDKRNHYANASTGFHMGVSIPQQTMDSIDPLKVILLLGDQHILETFHRSANEYTKSSLGIVSKLVKTREFADKAEDLAKKLRGGYEKVAKLILNRYLNRAGKYVSINVKDNYIEFRSAGGNYFEMQQEIKDTMMRYVYVMGISAVPELYRNEYMKKLYKLITDAIPQKDSSIDLFVKFTSGMITKDELVKNLQLKRNLDKPAPKLKTPKQPRQPRTRAPRRNPNQYLITDESGNRELHYFIARNEEEALYYASEWAGNHGLESYAVYHDDGSGVRTEV